MNMEVFLVSCNVRECMNREVFLVLCNVRESMNREVYLVSCNVRKCRCREMFLLSYNTKTGIGKCDLHHVLLDTRKSIPETLFLHFLRVTS